MKYVIDIQYQITGVIDKNDGVIYCFNKQRSLIGKIKNFKEHKYLYDNQNRLLAIFDGYDTYDFNMRKIDSGDLLYKIIFPNMRKIT